MEISERDGARILSISGYLDAHTAPAFESAIENELKSGKVRLVVDCAGLTYISSAGLGVFMSFLEEIREKGGDIKLASIGPKAFQILDVLGFPRLFDIVETVEEAAGRFGPPGGARDGCL
ncbi:MAG: anti-sigma factor antagonist [Candidatus Solibacter sp.]|nr:anti-sigma factor antagonist [Candidatus Solibacter sp.]